MKHKRKLFKNQWSYCLSANAHHATITMNYSLTPTQTGGIVEGFLNNLMKFRFC